MTDSNTHFRIAETWADEMHDGINLVIVGEESGANRRRWDLAWPRSILAQCRAAGCAFFCKQMDVDGKVTEDMSLFPADLRVRDMPRPAEVARG